jgi:hypothetical protein
MRSFDSRIHEKSHPIHLAGAAFLFTFPSGPHGAQAQVRYSGNVLV